MFIREIKKRIQKNGISYGYVQHRLVESIRTPNGPRQRIVLNLGTLDVAPSDYKTLANLIESLATTDQQSLPLPVDPKLETVARHFAEVLIRKRVQDQVSPAPEVADENDTQFVEVDVNSAITTNGRTLGCEHVSLSYLKRIGFFEVLDECDFSLEQQQFAVAQVCARLIHPASERESARWLRETSGLDELMNTDFSKVSDNTLHRAADQLLAAKDLIEEQLTQVTSDLFSLDDSLVLYDLTNTYFESPKRDSALATYGRSKERRSDCPLMTLALMVDEHGFPKGSHVLKGGVSEPHTLFDILPKLPERPKDAGPRTVIIDAGIATSENLEKLRADPRFEYVAVNRERLDTKVLFQDVESRTLVLSNNKTLEVKIIRRGDETFLLCMSKDREAKEKAMLDRRKAKFEGEMTSLSNGLAKPRTQKQYETIVERVGRIKERYKAGHLYDVDIKQVDGRATEIKWRFKPEKTRPPGEYVLRTSRKDLNDAQISSLHRTLTMIESSFRWLKSDLGLRPNYHQTDQRMEAHIFVSVLAYYVLAPILNKLNWGGEHISASKIKSKKTDLELPGGWRSVVNVLSTHSRVTTTFRCKEGKTMDIRTTLEPTAKQFEIYQRLDIPPRPLKNKVRMML